jgi:hypothetical protein
MATIDRIKAKIRAGRHDPEAKMDEFKLIVHKNPSHHHHGRLALVVETTRRRHGHYKRHRRAHILEPGRTIHMADTVTVGHQIAFSIEYVDTAGNPMLTAVTPDSPPTWTDAPSAAGVDTFTASADGTTAVLVATAAGSDTVGLSVTVAGVTYTASDLVTISAAPQVLGGVEIVSVVT